MFGARGVMTGSDCGSVYDGVPENSWLICFFMLHAQACMIIRIHSFEVQALQKTPLFPGHQSGHNETQSPRALISLRGTYSKLAASSGPGWLAGWLAC